MAQVADRAGSVGSIALLVVALALVARSASTQEVVASPTPAQNATGVSVETELSWETDAAVRSYSLRLQTSAEGIESAAFFATGVVPTADQSRFKPPALAAETKYFWQVVGVFDAGTTQENAVWSFTTAGTIPGPPWSLSSAREWGMRQFEQYGLLALVLSLFTWIVNRNNRAADVLLKLEDEFTRKCERGRPQIEHRVPYLAWKRSLSQTEPKINSDDVDNLLRFYVVLYGVRQARQVPDKSLSTAYRYWLAHYYRHDRKELREYINANFPTLRDWLLADTSWQARMRY